MIQYDAIPDGASTPPSRLEVPGRNDPAWDHYEVSLSRQRPRWTPVSTIPFVPKPLARPGSRLAAALFDALFAFLPGTAGHFVLLAIPNQPGWKTPAVGLLFLVPCLIQITLLARRGQTIGKMAMRIRIVRYDDQSNPGLWHGWLLRSGPPWLILVIPVLGKVFILIDLLFIFGPEHRCLHDMIADTKVVEA
jgi:uncharacterized RDD family membrane protein YckC